MVKRILILNVLFVRLDTYQRSCTEHYNQHMSIRYFSSQVTKPTKHLLKQKIPRDKKENRGVKNCQYRQRINAAYWDGFWTSRAVSATCDLIEILGNVVKKH